MLSRRSTKSPVTVSQVKWRVKCRQPKTDRMIHEINLGSRRFQKMSSLGPICRMKPKLQKLITCSCCSCCSFSVFRRYRAIWLVTARFHRSKADPIDPCARGWDPPWARPKRLWPASFADVKNFEAKKKRDIVANAFMMVPCWCC